MFVFTFYLGKSSQDPVSFCYKRTRVSYKIDDIRIFIKIFYSFQFLDSIIPLFSNFDSLDLFLNFF